MSDKPKSSPRAWVAFDQAGRVKAAGTKVAGPAIDFTGAADKPGADPVAPSSMAPKHRPD